MTRLLLKVWHYIQNVFQLPNFVRRLYSLSDLVIERLETHTKRMEAIEEHLETQTKRIEDLEEHLETQTARTETLIANYENCSSRFELVTRYLETMNRSLVDPTKLQTEVEHAFDLHPEWMSNPLLSYSHDYGVGNPDVTPLNTKILFVHPRKCGGTTLTHIMHRNVRSIAFRKDFLKQPNMKPRKILEVFRRLSEEQKKKEQEKWSKYDAFADHSTYGIHELLNTPYVYMTMLRDPIDRLVSMYKYRQQLPLVSWEGSKTHSERAMSLSFVEFLHDEFFAAHIRKHSYVTIFDGTSSPTLTTAKKNLQSFDTVLLLERFNDSMQLLEKKFGWKDELLVDGTVIPRNNRTVGDVTGGSRSQLTTEEIAVAEELCKEDIALYTVGKEHFEQNVQTLSLAHV